LLYDLVFTLINNVFSFKSFLLNLAYIS
jgi:hypothetical protein